ncbi:cation:proton antiporter [Amylibacter kogurei]|uniref:Cation:proton antiporter n=1 Tax=Paramylibacter kogurei TaxID=1889778 RepID=A0A2G5K8Z4_9RHOB|nr:monovalent cation/H+ antiporter subunit D family protein [Amylibacter kogurei]PIB25987.1 cation:proton antiporter [Amylibacter kogurei]
MIFDTTTAIILAMLIPLAAMAGNMAFKNMPNLRDGFTFLCAVLTFGAVLVVLANEGNSVTSEFSLIEVFPGIDIAFNVEPLGLMFAIIASGLWIITHIYGVGYMRGNDEKHHARFFACFAIAISSVMGIAFSSNMFTLFLFYEILTVSTYPLVAHKGTPDAVKGARTYLAILIGTSIALQLTAVIWTYALAGTLDFTQGGILVGKVAGWVVPVLLGLYAFGIGKAALMPFHKWLPAAMVAPTPVSALLHAVAVVKAGVFTMLKVGIYIFGIDFLAETGASEWLMWLAAYSIIAASVVAMTQDNLKKRLAYSTVSQLSYITLGMALATSMGALGGGMHIAMHAMGKITLFMCAGAIYVAYHKTEISQMQGLGRVMPITFGAFLIGSLSIIGLPPLGGSWPKFLLMLGAADTGHLIIIGVLMASSLLNVAYLLPIVGRGFFRPLDDGAPTKRYEGPVLVWLPPALTALGCFVLFFYGGALQSFLLPIIGQ